jgi:hypothetical protein
MLMQLCARRDYIKKNAFATLWDWCLYRKHHDVELFCTFSNAS